MLKHLFEKYPFHPLLFSAYPVLALLALNIDQIASAAAIRSLLFVCTLAIILVFLLNLMIKNWHRTAMLVSLFFILFFSYGHLYHYLESHPFLGLSLGRHRLLTMIWLSLGVLGIWAVLKKVKQPQKITKGLNILGIVLASMPVFMMLAYSIRLHTSKVERSRMVIRDGEISLQSHSEMPDIYYLVYDAYAREDVLKENLGYDNSAFITELERMGFYVAHCSQSNYGQTNLSIASSLNMDYIEQISERYLAGKLDMVWMPELIQENETRRNLKQLGYTDVTFENGFYALLWDNADVIYSKERSGISRGQSLLNVNGFEVMLLNESAFLLFTDTFSIFADRFLPIKNYPNNVHRDRILFMFEKLTAVPTAVRSPKFIYAHFVAPHFPVVLGPNGEAVTLPGDPDPETYAAGYTGEVTYLNKRILEVVREIIAISASPPVIIIQADHGYDNASSSDRMKILNAYYLPGIDQSLLYPSLSPVNTFRLVFNEYFNGNYPLLPDKSFFSPYQDSLEFTEIPNSCGH
jgi:hypothetical protein